MSQNALPAFAPVAAKHALQPATDAGDPLPGFFRHHGAWAPGIRLFRAISFRSKALVISAVFMVPIVWLAFAYYNVKTAAVAFSAKELVGVAYAREAMPLLGALQSQRQAAMAEAVTGKPAANGAEIRAALDGAFKKLATAEAAMGGELSTGQAYAALRAKAQALPAASSGLEEVKKAHNELLAAFIALITTSTDNSNLTLDPDLDTFYLMDNSLVALPQIAESLAQLRDMSMAILGGHQPSAEFSRRVVALEVLDDLSAERWDAGMAKVATLHPGIAQELDTEVARKSLKAFHQLAASSDSAPKLLSAGDQALKDILVAQDKSLAKLGELIQVRVDGLEADRMATTAVLLASLLGVSYFLICFRKVLEGGLREVALHIDAMRDGDLTTHPRAWGADEVASLMHTLSDMQTSLRRIVGQVRGASDSIVHASREISSASGDLSGRTEQSAANLEQTASAMEQIAATVRHNEETVNQATQLAASNAQTAERGGQIIGQVVQTMQAINSSSNRIGDIIGTIDGIAFQTNILALNAAVEAARAGEQGRGFAVVASEVRALAQRSAAAAREIKTLISASIEQVESGAKVVETAGRTIEDIVGSSRQMRDLLAEVASGAREQTQGIAQTAKAVQELDTVTQQNAALVEQTAAAAGSLNDQAVGLAGEVAAFKLPSA
jgi:methyl-accepting chemotaxis protein